MKSSAIAVLAGVLFATTGIPVYADNLLGSVLGGGGLGSIVSVDSGPASSGSLVNVGLGGGGGNLVDVNVGGSSSPIASANVGTGGGGLGVGANVLNDTVTANVGIGGGGGNLLTTSVGLGGTNLIDLNVGLGGGGPGTPGVPGTPGAPGTNGVNGNNGNNGNGSFASGGSRSRNGGVACEGVPANQVNNLLRSTRFDRSWSRASGVKVQPIAVCGDVKAWLNAQLSSSNLGAALRQAVQSDALVSASLSRTSYGPDRVLAVKQSGSQLIVYVY